MVLGGEAVKVLAEIQAAGERVQVHNVRLREWLEHRVQGELITDVRLKVSSRTVELPFKEVSGEEEYSRQLELLGEELLAIAGPRESVRRGWREGLQDYLERVAVMDDDTLSQRRRINALLTRLSSDRGSLGRMARMKEDGADSRATEIQPVGVSPKISQPLQEDLLIALGRRYPVAGKIAPASRTKLTDADVEAAKALEAETIATSEVRYGAEGSTILVTLVDVATRETLARAETKLQP